MLKLLPFLILSFLLLPAHAQNYIDVKLHISDSEKIEMVGVRGLIFKKGSDLRFANIKAYDGCVSDFDGICLMRPSITEGLISVSFGRNYKEQNFNFNCSLSSKKCEIDQDVVNVELAQGALPNYRFTCEDESKSCLLEFDITLKGVN